ncbi:MAG: ABC transporter permease, partial [bacterium]
MLKNYFKMALRNLKKHKGYSIINIFGLAIGMTCFLFIVLYVQKELSYDRFHENAERIYRIATESKTNDRISRNAGTQHPLAPVLRQDFPEFEVTGRFYFYEKALVEANGKKIYATQFAFAEPQFLQIFSFPLLLGDSHETLRQPNTVVVSQAAARMYFGEENPVGKRLRFENSMDFTIVGVAKDVPTNSHLSFDFLASYDNVTRDVVGFDPDQWGAFFGVYTYTLLPPETNVAVLEQKMSTVMNQHGSHAPSISRRPFLQALTDIHLRSHINDELGVNNHVSNLYILSTIGFFVLLIACINFMNLATARSVRRAKEVGVRKVFGALRAQLVRQFLSESILFAFFALFVSLVLIEFMLPFFNALIGKSLTFTYANHFSALAIMLCLALVVGVISGIYPAFVLSGFRPVDAVKGMQANTRRARSPQFLRRVLVVAQFSISIVLITGTIIMQKQRDFFGSANLGFDKELNVVIPMSDNSVTKQYKMIRSEWLTYPRIRGITASMEAPIGENDFETSLYPRGADGKERFGINLNFVDDNYLSHFGLTLLAGRNFSPELSTDAKRAMIVNESTLKKLGIVEPEDAIGKVYRIGLNRIDAEVIGVVKDFHIASLHDEIEPLVMMYWPDFFNAFSVKIRAKDIVETIAYLEESWSKFAPEFPFQYQFLDDYIAGLYQAEEQSQRIVNTFSLIAILITCLGLLGLASFTAEQRTKEIGIRKVLGATVSNITAMLSKDFVKPVLLANLIAWPVAWYVMTKWLQDFAYRIDIGWWIFALAGGLALVIALLTVSTQAIRAALA